MRKSVMVCFVCLLGVSGVWAQSQVNAEKKIELYASNDLFRGSRIVIVGAVGQVAEVAMPENLSAFNVSVEKALSRDFDMNNLTITIHLPERRGGGVVKYQLHGTPIGSLYLRVRPEDGMRPTIYENRSGKEYRPL